MMGKKFYCEKCKRQIETFDDEPNRKPRMCEYCFEKMINNVVLENANLRIQGEQRDEEIILPQQLKKQMEHIKKVIISKLKKKNPYPDDIFTPLSDKETKEYVKVLADNGFSSDKIHAHWMKYSWNLCVEQLERLFEDE